MPESNNKSDQTQNAETGSSATTATTEHKNPDGEQSDELKIRSRSLISMVEQLPVGAVFITTDKVTMNHAAEKITGYRCDELKTIDQWFTALHGNDVDQVRRIYEKARAEGFTETSDPISIICKNGSKRWIEFSAYRYDDHEVWLMNDVTDREQYEKQLRTSTERLRSIMDNAAESIIVINEDGLITDFNAASERLFGYHFDEAIGHNVKMLMPSPYREQHDSYIANYIITGKSMFLGQLNKRELPGLRKDGTIIPLELTINRIDHLRLFCGIIRDMSEHKALEKEVADICAREQDRIGQDIHDGLGQQLTGLGMMLSSLKRELARENIPQTEKLDEIISYVQKAAEDSRTISRGLAPMSIETLGLEDALKLLANDIQKTTGIKCTVESGQPVNINDNTITIQIYRIIQEAVNNAVKHANAKNIRIVLKNVDHFEFSVSDDGDGFQVTDDTFLNSLGVRIMRYRAGIIGCNLHIATSPQGTIISCKHVYRGIGQD